MITIRPGSHTHLLLQLLSTTGEIPVSALSFIGNYRVLDTLVRKLRLVQEIRFDKNGHVYHVKLIQISGKKGKRTIRLYKKGLDVLEELYPGLHNWYMDTFQQHTFYNHQIRIDRNHRVSEALALLMGTGIETRPYVLPSLQISGIYNIVPNSPSFYTARDIKSISKDETNKTAYTRIIGMLFYPGGAYAVYNTRAAVMKWSGLGEIKTLGYLQELVRMNSGLNEVSGALLFGQNANIALKTILDSDISRRPEMRFDRIYSQIHFVPLDGNGKHLIKMLVTPNWNEKLLNALFHNNQRSFNRGVMEYDAIVDGRMVLSFLDGNIARLIRFCEALNIRAEPADVLCYNWHVGFLKEYLGDRAGLRVLEPKAVESALGFN
jgi:hypothetical protein